MTRRDGGIYAAVDTGPSGHGQVARGMVRGLLDYAEDIPLTLRTHQWGWNREGITFQDARSFTDTRFRERVMNSPRYNEDYSIESEADIKRRPDDLVEWLGRAGTARPQDCPVREVTTDDEMDVWYTVGGLDWAEQAPDDEDVHTIVETDWNLDMVPQEWPELARQVDEVWVPNQWVYDAFDARGHTENVHIVPYGVDFSYRPTDYDCQWCGGQMHTNPPGEGACLADDTFTFFALARWYHIKGVDSLIEAFLREFSGEENVRLFFKTTMNQQGPISGGKVQQVISEAANQMEIDDVPEIGSTTDAIPDQQLMDVYGEADAFVMPSRAECVGIAWVQAMHAGTPVVTTDWSAMNEYLTDDHAVLVDEGTVERPQQYQPSVTFAGSSNYPPDSNWFDPDIDALRAAMREMYEMHADERDAMAARARDHVHDVFDWEKHMETRLDRIREVMA